MEKRRIILFREFDALIFLLIQMRKSSDSLNLKIFNGKDPIIYLHGQYMKQQYITHYII